MAQSKQHSIGRLLAQLITEELIDYDSDAITGLDFQGWSVSEVTTDHKLAAGLNGTTKFQLSTPGAAFTISVEPILPDKRTLGERGYRGRPYVLQPTLPNGCTGYWIHHDVHGSSIQHDGDTCPVHEKRTAASPTVPAHYRGPSWAD